MFSGTGESRAFISVEASLQNKQFNQRHIGTSHKDFNLLGCISFYSEEAFTADSFKGKFFL